MQSEHCCHPWLPLHKASRVLAHLDVCQLAQHVKLDGSSSATLGPKVEAVACGKQGSQHRLELAAGSRLRTCSPHSEQRLPGCSHMVLHRQMLQRTLQGAAALLLVK